MADKIDQLKIGSTSYDIDLPPDATPTIAGLTVDNGNMSQIYVSSHNGLSALTLGTDGISPDNGSNQLDIWVTAGLKFEQSKQDSGGLHVYTWTFPEQGGTVALTDNIAITNPTVSTTGSGNAVTGVSISNGQIVANKGESFVVTSSTNQDIDGIKTFTNRPRSVEVYTRYERIKSSAATGFPYIRTGVLRGIHYSTKLTCILEGYFNSSQTYGFCGYDSGGQLGQKSGKWSTENDGLGTTNVNCIGETNKATVKQVLDFSNSTNKLYIGSTMVAGRSISNTTFSQQADYPIFVAYNGTYSYNPGTLVLYSFKMYDGDDTTGTLIRDFIPVKNANNEIGLLDLVERKFYRNQGTIAFTAENETGTLQIGGDLLASSDIQTVALTGSYNDLSDKPSISNATITIKQTGISDQTFTLNGSAKTITLSDNNTNYYHSTGTWNDLTYTATANGGTNCPELKFTIPTGTTATTVCAGNDSRLSDARTPTSHTHGNITNTGTITSTAVTSATGVLVYDSSNKIQRATAASARSIISAASSGHTHGNITNTGAITSTAVTSATGVVVYDSNNKIQRATASNARTIIGAASTDDLATIVDLTSSNSSTASSIPLLLSVYPVGAIYISTDSTSPASLFGGTWEKLANRFLFAAGSGYNAGATGGEFTHTLTAAEMPVHSHNYVRYGSMTNYSHAGSSGYVNWDSQIGDTYNSGGDQPHNNMPPYLVVHMWKRVS